VGGDLTVAGGGGTNTLFIGFGAANFAPGQVNGNVNFTGSGTGRFFLDTGSFVGGNVTLTFTGNGDNELFLGTVAGADGTGFTIGGSFSATLGNGNDFIADVTAPSSIGGGMSLSVGGGNQTFTF